jgi:hypothetical protein
MRWLYSEPRSKGELVNRKTICFNGTLIAGVFFLVRGGFFNTWTANDLQRADYRCSR